MNEIIVKSQETRTGVRFRILKENGSYVFAELPFQNYFYVKLSDYEMYEEEYLQRWVKLTVEVIPIG